MNRLYVFGDSYSTPHLCVAPKDSFWGLTASYLQMSGIVNASRPVNSFDSICQLIIGMQNEYQYDWTNDWFLIGIPPLERVTVFDQHKDTQYDAKIIDVTNWRETDTTLQCHRGLISAQFYANDKFLTIHADRSWLETQILRELYLLCQWLDSRKANYLICNLSKPLDENNHWGPSEFVLQYTKEQERCIVFDNTYYSVNAGVHLPLDAHHDDDYHGHHGPAGNRHYFETSIKPLLDKLK